MKLKIDKKQANKILNKIAGKFALHIQKEIIKTVPKRFKNRIVVKKGKEWTVGTNNKIFEYWEQGTDPHIIRPKTSKSLKFQWENAPPSLPSTDGFYFFKKVKHPGTEGHKILKKLVNDKAKLKSLLNKALS